MRAEPRHSSTNESGPDCLLPLREEPGLHQGLECFVFLGHPVTDGGEGDQHGDQGVPGYLSPAARQSLARQVGSV